MDNVIAESGKDGQRRIRFMPVSAFQTSETMLNLCNEFNNTIERAEYDPLLLIPMFILDSLCIHPFNNGNGRMSRLLTLLLLYRSGYIAGKYVSMEMLIKKTKETYYEALQNSSTQWHNDKSDYTSFVRYYLDVDNNTWENNSAFMDNAFCIFQGFCFDDSSVCKL